MTSRHALIIDDNGKNLAVIARLLEKESFECTEVIHPGQLPPILDDLGQVDVVFLDLEMPELDGFEVLGMLRNNPDFDQTPIVAYSVHVSEITVAHAQGFDGFIGKPLNADRFPDQVARILRGEGVWETA